MQISIENKARIFNNIKLFLFGAIGITIAFSLLNLNSICIIALTAVWLLESPVKQKWQLLKADRLFIAYLLYFLVEAAGTFYTTDMAAGWKNTESKLGFFILPLIFCSSKPLDQVTRGKALAGFSLTITIASLYCLFLAALKFYQTGNSTFFFYHDLVSPLDHHAIYFSLFVFISLIFLFLNQDPPNWIKKNKWLRISWIAYYLLLLVLLASKMLLLVLTLFLLYLFLQQFRKKELKKHILWITAMIMLIVVLLFSVNNPIKRRFTDLLSTNMTFLTQEKFAPDYYFNGIELRLLLWRFTYEILSEKKAWIAGVAPADAQPALREKYLSVNMYAGEHKAQNEGYLVFNCHNQFLQTTLQSGLIGLLALLFWCSTLIRLAWRKKDLLLSTTLLVTMIFFFSESVFERQYGVILCTFFPLLLMYSDTTQSKKELDHS